MKNKKLLFTAVIVVLVFSFVFALAGCKDDVDVSGENPTNDIYNVGGYQLAPENVAAITKSGKEIVPISTMLEKENLKVKGEVKGATATKIAANIYHMIVRNADNTIGTGYRVATNASVAATDVHAKIIGIDINMPSFEVGIRSTYSSMDGPQGSFGQTVSGVTKLFLEGPLEPVGKAIKGNFGYNIQDFHNADFKAHRNGGNGGATFFNFGTDEMKAEAPKLILGATVGKKVEKAFPTKINNKHAWDKQNSFTTAPVEKAKAANTAADTAKNVWDPLVRNPFKGDPIKIQLPGQAEQTYELGNMGCGWALYNFNAEMLDPNKTVVTYDKDTDVYTLKISVLPEYTDDACEFAKNTLIKDTKNYVILDSPKYTKLENTIQVHGCGLIKCWERDELMESNKKAYLTVFTGSPAGDTANGGGSTGNKSISIFSYNANDFNAEAMAALYWPELGDANVMKKGNITALNLSKYDTYESYKPVINNK